MLMALKKFALDPKDINRYRMVEVSLEKGGRKEVISSLSLSLCLFFGTNVDVDAIASCQLTFRHSQSTINHSASLL